MSDIATDDIGGRLRHAREQRGLSLHDVARCTKLTIPVLRAIERNDFAVLPGGMFRKAYVRALAVEVGLNPKEIAADYCACFESPIERPSLHSRRAACRDSWLTMPASWTGLWLFALVAATLAITWFLLDRTFRAEVPSNGAFRESPASTTHPRLRVELAAAGLCWLTADTDGERSMRRLLDPGERPVPEANRVISPDTRRSA